KLAVATQATSTTAANPLTAAGVGNSVLGNSAYGNNVGITIGGVQAIANDPGDADTGPNNLQNYPALLAASRTAGGSTTVRGKLNSRPGHTYRVELFASPAPDVIGRGQGQTFLGAVTVTTDAAGNAPVTFTT